MTNGLSRAAKPPICAIVGAGPGNGAAFARKFAKEGYAVALLARQMQRLDRLAGESAWRINTLGAFLVAREVIPRMKAAGRGTIVFIGATASRRGGAKTAAFASAKAAQRSLAQSMARSLGPLGIHVALAIIDGVIDSPQARSQLPEKPDSFFLKPDAIAETVYFLTQQKKSAWTFELEVRPFAENW
jgi:NADP-dependent 3-hydroxy acid dehydrogenase YdfG